MIPLPTLLNVIRGLLAAALLSLAIVAEGAGAPRVAARAADDSAVEGRAADEFTAAAAQGYVASSTLSRALACLESAHDVRAAALTEPRTPYSEPPAALDPEEYERDDDQEVALLELLLPSCVPAPLLSLASTPGVPVAFESGFASYCEASYRPRGPPCC